MCVWTKKRGSMNAVVLMATPCPKSLAGDDDVYYYIRWRLKLEGETEKMGVCTLVQKGGKKDEQ